MMSVFLWSCGGLEWRKGLPSPTSLVTSTSLPPYSGTAMEREIKRAGGGERKGDEE
jgi:hypothetical protein